MAYRRQKRPPQLELPIVGNCVHMLVTEPLVGLLFLDSLDVCAQLQFEQTAIIDTPNGEQFLVFGAKPGRSFDPTALQPLQALIGKTVCTAIAFPQGTLEIVFDDETKLSVVPEVYEAWRFQKPAPGSIRPYPANAISLTGTDGELL
jgi:hypothetical protein